MNRSVLLEKLPPFSHRMVTIKKNQSVGDIVKEVLAAHEVFAPDYDGIAYDFDHGDNVETCKALFQFLKQNVRYRIESEEKQTTKSPAAIIEMADGDCKHYAGFIAGVLDALKRQGRSVNWHYRFASYNPLDTLPGHVFVVLNEGSKEYWIDPVLKIFNQRLEPTYILDKRVNTNHMLTRVSGIGELSTIGEIDDVQLSDVYLFDEDDEEISPEIMNAITILYQYGLLNSEGQVNDARIKELSTTLPQDEFDKIANARLSLHEAAIGGFFSNIWGGVKKVTLAVPRNAYLSLVGINAFGYATKLANALYKPDGSYYLPGKDKLAAKWKKLGGSFSHLEGTIKKGMRKKAILGQQPSVIGNPAAAAVPAWVAVATAVIAAITPLIKQILGTKASEGQLAAGVDPTTGLPYGMNVDQPNGGSDIMDFIQQNPLVVAGAAALAVYFLSKKSA